jgi:excisionase family DNA binding protein
MPKYYQSPVMPEYLTLKEASEYVGCPSKVLRMLAKAGKIRAARLFGQWVFKPSWLDKEAIDKIIEEIADETVKIEEETLETKLLHLLEKHPEGLTKGEIERMLRAYSELADKVIKRGEEEGLWIVERYEYRGRQAMRVRLKAEKH